MCRRTIYDARNNFSALVKLAESGESVELTRHDKPVAVIISWEEYEKQFKPKKTFIQRLMETRANMQTFLLILLGKVLKYQKMNIQMKNMKRKLQRFGGKNETCLFT